MTLDFQNKSLISLDMPAFAYVGNGVQLLQDGDMALAGTAWWTAGNSAVLTKQSGAPGYTQCLRVAVNVVANPFAANTSFVQTVGCMYRLRGVARGDGVNGRPLVLDSGATFLFQGTTSTAWQAFDVTFTAVGASLYFFNYAASGYAEFTALIEEFAPASTRNLGTLGGYAQLGNGYTAAGFPTQLAPTHGMSFDGGDYLQIANDGTFDFRSGGVDQPFSVEFLLNITSGASSSLANKGTLFGAPGGWGLNRMSATTVGLILTDSAGNYFYASIGDTGYGVVKHLVFVYTGSGASSGISGFFQGVQRTTTTGAVGVYGGLPTGVLPVTIGSGGGYSSLVGKIYNAAIYPFALQPGEVSQLYQLRRSMINRGF
jgi:hypothetical protein